LLLRASFYLPSSSFGTLRIRRICDISYSTFRGLYIDFSPVSLTFLCLPGAWSTFFDLPIHSVYLIYPSTFHRQLIMMALASEPCQIDFRPEKGKLELHLQRRSGQEVQDQKHELTARIDERIQKVSDFRVEPGALVQQSAGHQVPGCDRREGARCRNELDAEAGDGRATNDDSTDSLGARGKRCMKSRRSSNTMGEK
jgi:hypothetical protein